PALPREQTSRGGEQGAVGRAQPWALDLAAQDPQLMPEHDQLDVLGGGRTPAADHQLQKKDECEVDEGEEHRAMLAGSLLFGPLTSDQSFGTLQGHPPVTTEAIMTIKARR